MPEWHPTSVKPLWYLAGHPHGNEAGWWENLRVDPTVAARALWLESHKHNRSSSVDSA
jgi:hypothetical protein